MNKLSRHGFCGNIDLSAKQREVQLRVESLHQEHDNEEKLDFFENFCQEKWVKDQLYFCLLVILALFSKI